MNWAGGIRKRVVGKEEEKRRMDEYFANYAVQNRLRLQEPKRPKIPKTTASVKVRNARSSFTKRFHRASSQGSFSKMLMKIEWEGIRHKMKIARKETHLFENRSSTTQSLQESVMISNQKTQHLPCNRSESVRLASTSKTKANESMAKQDLTKDVLLLNGYQAILSSRNPAQNETSDCRETNFTSHTTREQTAFKSGREILDNRVPPPQSHAQVSKLPKRNVIYVEPNSVPANTNGREQNNKFEENVKNTVSESGTSSRVATGTLPKRNIIYVDQEYVEPYIKVRQHRKWSALEHTQSLDSNRAQYKRKDKTYYKDDPSLIWFTPFVEDDDADVTPPDPNFSPTLATERYTSCLEPPKIIT